MHGTGGRWYEYHRARRSNYVSTSQSKRRNYASVCPWNRNVAHSLAGNVCTSDVRSSFRILHTYLDTPPPTHTNMHVYITLKRLSHSVEEEAGYEFIGGIILIALSFPLLWLNEFRAANLYRLIHVGKKGRVYTCIYIFSERMSENFRVCVHAHICKTSFQCWHGARFVVSMYIAVDLRARRRTHIFTHYFQRVFTHTLLWIVLTHPHRTYLFAHDP